MEWILNNKEWIFSGIGVAVISLAIGLVCKKKSEKSIHITQKSGRNSRNFQKIGITNNGKQNRTKSRK